MSSGRPVRRAKAKLFDGKQEQDFLGLPPDAPQTLAAAYDPELNVLLHETDRKSKRSMAEGQADGNF